MNVFTVLNQANGRDKVARFIQYLCRTLSYLKENDANHFKILEATFSTFRKLLRFGKSLESLVLATKLMDEGDIMKRVAALIKVSHGCYLLCDHIETIGRLKIANIDVKDWNLSANRFWVLMDVLNLVQNYYQLKKSSYIFKSNNVIDSKNRFKLLIPLYLDFLKNVCDIFLPLCAINVVKISPGMTGALGMISSLLGLYLLFQPFSGIPAHPDCQSSKKAS